MARSFDVKYQPFAVAIAAKATADVAGLEDTDVNYLLSLSFEDLYKLGIYCT